MFVPLGELLLGIETGKSFKCEERPPTNDEIGVVKVSSVSWGEYQESESKTCTDAKRIDPSLFVRRGDFLFSRANTIELVGACVIAQQVTLRVMLSDKILRFRFARDEMKSWVLYLLRSDQGRSQIETLASGNQNSMRNIGQTRIGQILVPLPPAAEQTRIVAKLEELLSDLEVGVAELKAAQAKLARYRQSLLKAAVDGALTADWRARHTPAETGAQLLARILTERRARWEDKQRARFAAQGKTPPKNWQAKYPEPVAPDTTELPALPAGWVWASLDQLSALVKNGLSKKPSSDPIGYPILRINAVRPLSVDLDEVRYLQLSEDEATGYVLEEGDLLATRYNGSVDLLGVFGVVRRLKRPTLHPDKLIRIKPVLDGRLAEWIEICAAVGRSRQHVVSRVKTTAGQTGISGEDIKKMPIPVAPSEEQETVIQLTARLLDDGATQAGEIENLLKQSTAQRKNLLKAAFSGQLVPQDPADEPASVLLERIRAERDARGAVRQGRGGRRRRVAQGGA